MKLFGFTVKTERLAEINHKLNALLVQGRFIMSQIDDLTADLVSLKTELDAAKDRDGKIQASLVDVQAQLAALIANPPAGPDLAPAIQSVMDAVAEAQTIGAPAPVVAPPVAPPVA